MLEKLTELRDFRMNDCYHSNNDYNHFTSKTILFIKEIMKKRRNSAPEQSLYQC
ncbi:hypothetical protein ALTERO38_51060 [Alteromonas sp. 38]|nr:hypothetical protein ALTER154_70242 [Alteromonas sp. 154]VXB58927.1 hypothetical protein ALTERO38_51060 [Alteromonas sp. 38]